MTATAKIGKLKKQGNVNAATAGLDPRLQEAIGSIIPYAEATYFAVRVEGLSPLLMHKPDMDDFSGKKAKNLTPEEAAAKARYLSADGTQLVLPTIALRNAMLTASSRESVKVNGKKVSLKNVLAADVSFAPELAPLGHDAEDYVVDKRIVRNEFTGGRMIAGRACLPKWDAWVVLCLDARGTLSPTDNAHLSMVQSVLQEAGRRVGVLSYRPANLGWFGRFGLAHFEKIPSSLFSTNGDKNAKIEVVQRADAPLFAR